MYPFDAAPHIRYCKAMSSQHLSFLPQEAQALFPIGIDEAGRGCLAGPVVAAAVLLPESCIIEGLGDSKKLSAVRREKLAKEILLHAHVGIGLVWQKDIDRINILQATFHAMSRAVRSLLGRHPHIYKPHLHIDGNKILPPAVLQQYKLQITQQCLIGGDGLMPCIGAASIIAKTHRDGIMQLLHKRYVQYNFAGHKGYGTKEHVKAIENHGPCPLHRMTFAPLSTLCPTDVKPCKNPTAVQGSLV